ncbi:hypothetical protein DFJ58DRAFT_733152 [Suillus subalutaceus]|uniref:uncharacterized protein n=1 Tax=Suillus subalutaceus TaxID=48586 RepID=UPI001B869C81|nr:uncharacterized protein DFJ58DRAFT_733152 [Suillus subalutaceus]KAG1839811.1 hypothetical protein DFJ58DRAFT_733152 [Suillus subalutaceus]
MDKGMEVRMCIRKAWEHHRTKLGQFWPDGQEPPFKGQKATKHIFVTKGKMQPRKEIIKNYEEIKELKKYVPSDIFHPRTGDIELYYNYSDYDGTDEEDLFDIDEDDAIPPPAVAPIPPPTVVPAPPRVTVHVLVGKWEVSSMLLPSSDAVNVQQILKFTLLDIDDGSFAQARASCFDSACPNENLDLPPFIPPKLWVYSLRESLDDAIREGKRLIIHPQLKDQPLPLWMRLFESLRGTQKLHSEVTAVAHRAFSWAIGNTLAHGIQQDSISCGLFCINTIAHNVFGNPLGVPDPARARAKWFQWIAYKYITVVPQEEIPTISMSDMVVGPPPPPSTSPGGLPQCQTETEQQKKEKRKQLIPIFKEKADARAANVARDKKEKEMEEQKEIKRQKEVERQLEIERHKQLEIERQMEVERQKQLEIERQMEVERQLEIKRQQEADRQRELEIKRQQDLEIERQKEADRQRELEHQKRVQKVDSGGQVITDDSMDIDIEPGEVTSGSHAPSPTKGKMDTVNRRDCSPRHPHAPFVPNRSHRSLSPPPHELSYHASRRELSPPVDHHHIEITLRLSLTVVRLLVVTDHLSKNIQLAG